MGERSLMIWTHVILRVLESLFKVGMEVEEIPDF